MDIAAAAALSSQAANPQAGLIAVKIAAQAQQQMAQLLAQVAEAGRRVNLPDHLGTMVNTSA
jgi:predicted ATPase